MSRLTAKTKGKKTLCNPPVLAKVTSAEALIADGCLSEEDVQALIKIDESFVADYNQILTHAIERMR